MKIWDYDEDIAPMMMRLHLPYGNYDNDYNSGGRYSGHQDWNSGSYSQSFDDFHEEQDDYNMLDDDF